MAKGAEQVVILTGRVKLVTYRVEAEETTHHQKSKSNENAQTYSIPTTPPTAPQEMT